MKSIAIALIVMLFVLVGNVAANEYIHTFYTTNTTMTAGTIEIPGVYKDEACTAIYDQKAYLVGSGFDTGVNYFSPSTTQIGTATKTNKNVILCTTFGEYDTTTDLSGFYEGYTAYTTSATSGNLTLTARYNCTESSLYYDILGDMSKTDSLGNIVSRYASSGGAYGSTYYNAIYGSSYHDCYSGLHAASLTTASSGGSSCVDYRRSVYAYYPFNSGPEGIVSYSFNMGNTTYDVVQCSDTCTGTQTAYANLYLVKIEDETNNLLWSDSVDCGAGGTQRITGTVSGDLTLDADADYAFTFATYNGDSGSPCPCARSYSHREPLDFNISVYVYSPSWDCGAWSECVDSEQYRQCEDPAGIAVSKTEFQTCDITVIENATLGFEEYYTDFALKCLPTWFLGCGWYMENITRDTPVGWTVGEDFFDEGLQRDFLRMTQSWASEGSRSLMMWHIPPKEGEPTDNTTCGNVTYGVVPVIQKDVSNTTFSVDFNVTFPAENMLLSVDTKGCAEQVLHHDALTTLFGVVELCPMQCYAGNCSTIPDAEFQIILRDETGDVVTNYYGEANHQQTSRVQMDLTGLGIVAGENYTIQIQALPETLNSQAGNCVMFDNMKYEVLADPYLDIIGGDCAVGNKCVGTTLYETHLYENGACSVVRIEVSPECASGDNKDKIENFEDFCEDDETLYHFDTSTGTWTATTCDYICYEDQCMTEDEYDTSTEGETPTPETTAEYIDAIRTNIVTFVISLIVMVICIIVALKRDHAWPLALFGIAEFVFVCSIIGVLSIWFAVGIIVIAACIFAYFVSKPAGGN